MRYEMPDTTHNQTRPILTDCMLVSTCFGSDTPPAPLLRFSVTRVLWLVVFGRNAAATKRCSSLVRPRLHVGRRPPQELKEATSLAHCPVLDWAGRILATNIAYRVRKTMSCFWRLCPDRNIGPY